jgi:hypothetical protein
LPCILAGGKPAPSTGRGVSATGGRDDGKRGSGVVLHEASNATKAIMAAVCVAREKTVMALLLLEALGALLILVFIVWWTMFSGRKNGELRDADKPEAPPAKPDDPL